MSRFGPPDLAAPDTWLEQSGASFQQHLCDEGRTDRQRWRACLSLLGFRRTRSAANRGCSSGPSRAWRAMTLFPIRACTRCCARRGACGLAPKAGSLSYRGDAASKPPSTDSSCPVTKAASSLAALGILPTHMTRHAHRAAPPSPRRRLTAREMEAQAAAAQAVAPAPLLPAGEAMAMPARRGFRHEVGRPDLACGRDLA